MLKLSAPLKALINAPFARPGATAAPPRIGELYRAIAADAAEHRVGNWPWITLAAAATITLNAPDALLALHRVATAAPVDEPAVATAELIREVGLKCIGFNGIPRTINVLGAFRAGLPADVAAGLATEPTRLPATGAAAADGLATTTARGLALWRSVYAGVDQKLLDKLALAHPDLPVHILHSHYGPLFTDPPGHGAGGASGGGLATVGRALTSLLAIACLRAQTGVGPQVVSHVFGLRKAVADGTWLPTPVLLADGSGGVAPGTDAAAVAGVEWLATDAGSEWLLGTVDQVVAALGGSNFAGGGEGSGGEEGEAITAKL